MKSPSGMHDPRGIESTCPGPMSWQKKETKKQSCRGVTEEEDCSKGMRLDSIIPFCFPALRLRDMFDLTVLSGEGRGGRDKRTGVGVAGGDGRREVGGGGCGGGCQCSASGKVFEQSEHRRPNCVHRKNLCCSSFLILRASGLACTATPTAGLTL